MEMGVKENQVADKRSFNIVEKTLFNGINNYVNSDFLE